MRPERYMLRRYNILKKNASTKEWIPDFSSQAAKISQHFIISNFNLHYSIITVAAVV